MQLKNIHVYLFDENSLTIQGKDFLFSYQSPEIVKEEFRKDCRYFGGLQCQFEEGTEDYIKLENELIELAEKILK